MITADEALRLGLVQKVVEPDKLMEEAMAIAKKIASKGPKAIKKIKKVTREGMLTDFKSGSELESEEFGSLFGNEGAEGMRAFLRKKKTELVIIKIIKTIIMNYNERFENVTVMGAAGQNGKRHFAAYCHGNGRYEP